MENKNEMMIINADKIAVLTGYKSEEVAIIKNTIAKNTTDTELAYFLSVCRSVNLNPFLKEIWCYKDAKGNLIVFAGRDGFLSLAQKDQRWNGMLSSYVCKNDTFKMNVAAGTVSHEYGAEDRGAIIGAYAIIKPKGCDMPTVSWAAIKEYDKGYNTWNTNKGAMIVKVAETMTLKKAFGISGLQSEYDFEVKNNIVIPIQEVTDEPKKSTEQLRFEKLLNSCTCKQDVEAYFSDILTPAEMDAYNEKIKSFENGNV